MAILVDYVCRGCDGRVEAWVASPPPAVGTCPACGAESRRGWAPIGTLTSRPRTEAAGPSARSGGRRAAPLCASNPDVPGLCHMSPAAGRTWVARARRDNRSLERELARQEKAAAVVPPTLADITAHDHGHH